MKSFSSCGGRSSPSFASRRRVARLPTHTPRRSVIAAGMILEAHTDGLRSQARSAAGGREVCGSSGPEEKGRGDGMITQFARTDDDKAMGAGGRGSSRQGSGRLVVLALPGDGRFTQ